MTALRTGRVHLQEIPPPKEIETLKKQPELKTSETAGSAFHHLRFNPKVNELLHQTRAVSDQTQRKALYGELMKILAEDVPWVVLVARPEAKWHARRPS